MTELPRVPSKVTEYPKLPSEMIEYPKLTLDELVEECGKGGIEEYRREEMIAALQNRYKTQLMPQTPQPTRISIQDPKNRWRKNNYHNYYEYQLKAECVERKLELDHSEGKAELIDMLLRDDERLLLEELVLMILNKDSDMEDSMIRLLEFYWLATRVKLTSENIVFELRLDSDRRRFESGLDSKDSGKRIAFDLRQNNRRAEFRAQQEAIKLQQYDEAGARCRQIRKDAFAARAQRVAQEIKQCEQASISTASSAQRPSETPTTTHEIEQALRMELQELSSEESATVSTTNDEFSSEVDFHHTTQKPSRLPSSPDTSNASETQQENDKYKGPASNTIEDNYSPDRDINFNNDRDLGNDNNSNLDTGSLHHPIVLSDSEEEDGNNSDDSFNPNVDEESEQEDEEEAGSAALRGRSSSHDSELVADDNLPSHHFDDDDSSTVYPASDEESFHDYHSISNDDDIYGHDTFSNEIYSVDSDSSSTYDAHDDDSTFSNDESASVTDDRESFNFNDVFGNDAPFMDEEEYNYGDISSDDVVDDDDDDAVSSEIEELASNFRPAAKRSPPTNDDPRTQNTGSEDSRDRSQEGKRKGDELASEHAKKVRTTWLSTDSPDPAESANSSSLAWTQPQVDDTDGSAPRGMLLAASSTPVQNQQTNLPSLTTNSRPHLWDGKEITMGIPSAIIDKELGHIPHIKLTRTRRDRFTNQSNGEVAKSQMRTLKALWDEDLRLPNKRFIVADKEGVINVFFQNTTEGKREAEGFCGNSNLHLHCHWAKGFHVDLQYCPGR